MSTLPTLFITGKLECCQNLSSGVFFYWDPFCLEFQIDLTEPICYSIMHISTTFNSDEHKSERLKFIQFRTYRLTC